MAAAISSSAYLPLSRSEAKPRRLPYRCRTLNPASSRGPDLLWQAMKGRAVVVPVTAQDLQGSNPTSNQEDGREAAAAEDGPNGSSTHSSGFAFESGGVGDMGGDRGFSLSPIQVKHAGSLMGRAINATIVLAAGTFAVTKLLTIDRDYWHGWTLYEILRYAPQHNWTAYEEALKTNPVLAKMMISGVVYSLGDWIAQCYEGKPLFDFDRTRMFRSGLVGFTLHGSLSHYYYQFCEALFPFQEWWVVPAKVMFDQTAWAALWNSIYYVALGFLRFESPANIFTDLMATFWPMLTAGWKLWPFAHLITYGLIPVEQRLLWVDCVELVWVTILSTYSNEMSEAKNSEAMAELKTNSPSTVPEVVQLLPYFNKLAKQQWDAHLLSFPFFFFFLFLRN